MTNNFIENNLKKSYRLTYYKPIHDHLYHTKPTHWYSGVENYSQMLK